MEDGGEVFVEVCSDPGLLDDSPIIILLHTITGSSKETKLYMKQALKRGWRGIVFDRRGHVGKLKSPAFNVLGEADDTVKQVEFVRRKYPKSFLGMVGISAGSGLLVNYLGKCGELTPIQAACCLCPAYDISEAFKLMAQNFPHIDRRMTNAVKKLFILPNAELLGSHCYDSLEMCANAATLDEFVRNHHYFAGCSSAEDYFANNNPMEFIGKVSVPLLVVNSEDDMVCLPQNIREDLFKYKYGNTLLLRTKRGSHIAYNEGLLGQGSYLPRISLEFLQAARQVLGSNTDLGRTSRSPSTFDSKKQNGEKDFTVGTPSHDAENEGKDCEDEKKRKAEEQNEEKRKIARSAGVPENFFDAAKTKAFLNLNKAPQKSILKNSRPTPANTTAPKANSKANGNEWISSEPVLNKHSFKTPAGGSIKHLEEEGEGVPSDFFDSKKGTEPPVIGPTEDVSLPEGFFDDPIQDAKARGIEYKDPEEEEWEAFKKEIAVEVAVAQDIQAEGELEETAERQMEEIEDQMRAWSRVREIEIKKDEVDEKLKAKKSIKEEGDTSDEELEDLEMDEFLDWRLKKS